MSSVKITILDPIFINIDSEPKPLENNLVVPNKDQPMLVGDSGEDREIRVQNGKLFYKSDGNWYVVTANQLGLIF